MKYSYTLIKKIFPEVPAKKKLAELLNRHSFEVEGADGDTIEVSLPANIYSYASSHIGIAREASIISGKKFKSPVTRIVNIPKGKKQLKLSVKAKDSCSRYTARVFNMPEVGASDPKMAKILKSCGINPINSVVDILNYAMLETGQPLHAFDYDKLADANKESSAPEIIVRHSKSGEKIKSLDGDIIEIPKETLLIADKSGPLAIAGIKGGKDSGVSKSTTRIILEGANFSAPLIFRTARKLDLLTDAAGQFSHGISPALVDWGIDRATELLVALGAELTDSVEYYPSPPGDSLIEFDTASYERLIGAPIGIADAKRLFTGLGFSVETKIKKGQGILLVRVPSWRNDIENSEGLAEEVARIYGYDSLLKQSPRIHLSPAKEDEEFLLKDRIRGILTGLGFSESYNHSFASEETIKDPKLTPLVPRNRDPVELENPIAEDKRYLRPALLPLLLQNAKENSKHMDEVQLFEVGKVFRQKGKIVEERLHAGIVISARERHNIILELKGAVSALMEALGIGDLEYRDNEEVLRAYAGGHTLAEFAQSTFGRGWHMAVVEIDAERAMEVSNWEREFESLPKFPGIYRDVSILAPSALRIGEILALIQDVSPEYTEDVDLIDEYFPKGSSERSLTFRVHFRAEDRTLTDDEANKELNNILASLKEKFSVEER